MILGAYFPPPIARFILRHPALARVERSISVTVLRLLMVMANAALGATLSDAAHSSQPDHK